MGKISRDDTISTSATSVQVSPARLNRVAVYITTLDTAAITITKGETPAIMNAGIILQPTMSWYEVDNGDGFRCWRGPIQVIGTQAGNISISEDMEIKD